MTPLFPWTLKVLPRAFLKAFLRGIRTLIVLDEKLSFLGKEGEKTRAEVRSLIESLARLTGQTVEADKRISERFSELDKRLSEIDKRIDLKIEIAMRDYLDKLYNNHLANLPSNKTRVQSKRKNIKKLEHSE